MAATVMLLQTDRDRITALDAVMGWLPETREYYPSSELRFPPGQTICSPVPNLPPLRSPGQAAPQVPAQFQVSSWGHALPCHLCGYMSCDSPGAPSSTPSCFYHTALPFLTVLSITCNSLSNLLFLKNIPQILRFP